MWYACGPAARKRRLGRGLVNAGEDVGVRQKNTDSKGGADKG